MRLAPGSDPGVSLTGTSTKLRQNAQRGPSVAVATSRFFSSSDLAQHLHAAGYMRVAIMQPTYLPWLGYFDLMDQVDLFVLLDDVPFSKQSWHQRNRVKGSQGFVWLTVPVKQKLGQLLRDTEIARPDFWRKHLRSLECSYSRAPYGKEIVAELGELFANYAPWVSLVDLTSALLDWTRGKLGITTPVVRSSELPLHGARSERLAKICLHFCATEYLSPLGSVEYLRSEYQPFAASDIRLLFHRFAHPHYSQLCLPFLPHASTLDLLANAGPDSLAIIRSGRRAPMSAAEAFAHAAELGKANWSFAS